MKNHAQVFGERDNLENFIQVFLNCGYKNKSYVEESHPTPKKNVKEKNLRGKKKQKNYM